MGLRASGDRREWAPLLLPLRGRASGFRDKGLGIRVLSGLSRVSWVDIFRVRRHTVVRSYVTMHL